MAAEDSGPPSAPTKDPHNALTEVPHSVPSEDPLSVPTQDPPCAPSENPSIVPIPAYEDTLVSPITPPRYEHIPTAPSALMAYDEARCERYPELFSTSKVENSTAMKKDPIILVGPNPVRALCPFCDVELMTRTKFKNSSQTHLLATILGTTTCLWCIPYIFKSFKNVNHYCSSCGAFLGTYHN